MSQWFNEKVTRATMKEIKKLTERKAEHTLAGIQKEYAENFSGDKFESRLIFFGIEHAVRNSWYYLAALIFLIVFSLALGIPFGIGGQVKIFIAIIAFFALWFGFLAYKLWSKSGFLVCSDAFIGVYYYGRKKAETTPSRIRRTEFSKRFLKVTCATEEEDFMLPLTDKGYLDFLIYLKPHNESATENIDYDKIAAFLSK